VAEVEVAQQEVVDLEGLEDLAVEVQVLEAAQLELLELQTLVEVAEVVQMEVQQQRVVLVVLE
jgi:hypothetical protein